MRAAIGLTTPRPGRVPVLLAALAPQMLRLAGQRTDGTVLWMTGPATVRDYIVPAIREAAQAAGRPSPRVVCVLPVCVTDDPDGARARANRVFAIYGQLPSYRAMLDKEGAEQPGDVALAGDENAVAAQISRSGGSRRDRLRRGRVLARRRSRAHPRAAEVAARLRFSAGRAGRPARPAAR